MMNFFNYKGLNKIGLYGLFNFYITSDTLSFFFFFQGLGYIKWK